MQFIIVIMFEYVCVLFRMSEEQNEEFTNDFLNHPAEVSLGGS